MIKFCIVFSLKEYLDIKLKDLFFNSLKLDKMVVWVEKTEYS